MPNITRIAINGLGRIGRTFMKLALEHPALEVVAANDISDAESLAYLIKYDSVYGKYQGPVTVEHVGDEVWLQVGTRRLRLFAERRPEAVRGVQLVRQRIRLHQHAPCARD
jgi:glyceraldehyde 3-phosphate dehydrogenase